MFISSVAAAAAAGGGADLSSLYDRCYTCDRNLFAVDCPVISESLTNIFRRQDDKHSDPNNVTLCSACTHIVNIQILSKSLPC